MPLHKALNYILAEDIVVKENVPGFRRSSVDGYAVIAKDTFGSSENMPGFLTVAGEVKMGETPQNALSVERPYMFQLAACFLMEVMP